METLNLKALTSFEPVHSALCSHRQDTPITTTLKFLEVITNEPFENIIFYNNEDPRNQSPLTELLAECVAGNFHLNLLSNNIRSCSASTY